MITVTRAQRPPRHPASALPPPNARQNAPVTPPGSSTSPPPPRQNLTPPGVNPSIGRSDTVMTQLPTYEFSERQTGNVVLSWSPPESRDRDSGAMLSRSDTVTTLPTYEVVERQTENALLGIMEESEGATRRNTLLPTYEHSERQYRANLATLSEEQEQVGLSPAAVRGAIPRSRSAEPMRQLGSSVPEVPQAQAQVTARSRTPQPRVRTQSNNSGETLGMGASSQMGVLLNDLQDSNAANLRRRQAVATARNAVSLPTYIPVIPTTSIRYSFTSPTANSMDLVELNAVQADPKPLYRISVSMNCFIPSSYITTLRKVEDQRERYVGEFEMGVSAYGNSVKFGDRRSLIKNKLVPPSAMNMNTYIWKDDRGQPFYLWEFATRTKATCRLRANRNVILGTFWGSPDPSDPSTEIPNPMLEVTPSGHEQFDELMISLLVVERARLTPPAQQPT